MIFITLGSQRFQFNRILQVFDQLVENGTIKDTIFAQVGYSDYKPEHYKFVTFMEQVEFSREIDKAEIVVAHGGTGAIIGAVKKGKKVIAVPRLAKYGEHVDDHQLQIVRQFNTLGLIYGCDNMENIVEALANVRKTEYKKYKSDTNTIIDSIEDFLKSIE